MSEQKEPKGSGDELVVVVLLAVEMGGIGTLVMLAGAVAAPVGFEVWSVCC